MTIKDKDFYDLRQQVSNLELRLNRIKWWGTAIGGPAVAALVAKIFEVI